MVEHSKKIFSYFISLTTSSWQIPRLIRSEYVISAMQWWSQLMRLNTAYLAHQNLFHRKLSIRPLCQKHRTSGKSTSWNDNKILCLFVLCQPNNLFFFFSLFYQASWSNCISVVCKIIIIIIMNYYTYFRILKN